MTMAMWLLRPTEKVEVTIQPDSQRLQKLEPFAAWNGEDFMELPLLIKTQENVLPTTSLWPDHGCASADTWKIFPIIC